MSFATEALFREDAYLAEATASVVHVNDRGGIILDRTIFYATSGGQPGDTGLFKLSNGGNIEIAATITGETKDEIIHVPAPDETVPKIGERLKLDVNWQRRYRLMRMHTACHLLTVDLSLSDHGRFGGRGRLPRRFRLPDAGFTKEDLTERLMELVAADHPVFTRLITDEELAANPGLVKSKNVRPPTGTGKIRLVCIGENAAIDSQPCGGTHVKSTAEVGEIHIGKIEKKGRENRRFRLRFGPMPAA